jgi:hypothetical protein
MGRVRGVDHAHDLQFDTLRERVEESSAVAEQDRDLVDLELKSATMWLGCRQRE